MTTAKFVNEIKVVDPDSNDEVELSIFKHENGGMFAIDSSYIDQVLPDDGSCYIPDPFDTYSPDNMYNSIEGCKLTGI